MRQYFKFIPFLFFFQIGWAQYTEVINSRRPGFSDSPYSLGTGVYQVEGGLFYKNIGNYLNYYFLDGDSNISNNYSSTSIGSDIFLRSGLFFERLELNIDMSVRHENRDVILKLADKVNNKNHSSSLNTSSFGLDKFNIGAKFLVYKPTYTDKSKEIRSWKARHSFDFKRLIPAVAVYAGINTNMILDDLYKDAYVQNFIADYNKNELTAGDTFLNTPEINSNIGTRFAIYTQNDLSEQWIVLTNFIAEQVFTEYMEGSFIMTTTYTFLDKRWSVFGEGQLFYRTQNGVPNDYQFGAGLVYLFNKNIQIDLAGRMILDERGDNTYQINSGISWRMDKHLDKFITKSADNSKISMPKEERSFFNKITFGLFSGHKSSKKVKNPAKVKTVKAKQRKLEPPVNKKAQKAKKKRNKQLIKEQRRKEKAEKKYYKKKKKTEDQN